MTAYKVDKVKEPPNIGWFFSFKHLLIDKPQHQDDNQDDAANDYKFHGANLPKEQQPLK